MIIFIYHLFEQITTFNVTLRQYLTSIVTIIVTISLSLS